MKFKTIYLAGPACGLLAVALLSAAVMLIWNAVMPAIFPNCVQAIGYWQALGLLALSRILFGGFRGRGRGPGPRGAQRWQKWEKWHAMTPEERAQFHKERGGWGRRGQ